MYSHMLAIPFFTSINYHRSTLFHTELTWDEEMVEKKKKTSPGLRSPLERGVTLKGLYLLIFFFVCLHPNNVVYLVSLDFLEEKCLYTDFIFHYFVY